MQNYLLYFIFSLSVIINVSFPHPININNASKEELLLLKGIGEVKANAIIDYRKTHPFKTIEEITNVKGIGPATFEAIKDNITLDPIIGDMRPFIRPQTEPSTRP